MSDQGNFSPFKVVKFHENLDQEVIQITEDRLRIIVDEHLKKNQSLQDSLAISGLFFTTVTTLNTAVFNDNPYISAHRLDGLYFLLSIVSGVWLAYSVYKFVKSPDLNALILKVKNQEKK